MRKIAILDTGVGASKDDFAKLNVKKSLDFTKARFNESDIGLDDNGHGTLCAKVILKNTNEAEIYSMKVLDKNRCGKMLDLYLALQYLLTHEVDIINMSLAFSENCFTEKIRTTCEKLSKQGKIIVASIGRYENRPFPATFPCVLGVQGREFKNDTEFIYEPFSEVQITADDTPILAEWKNKEITILGGTSKAAALISGKIAGWGTNINQRLITDSGIQGKCQRKTNRIISKKNYIQNQMVLQEIVKLIPCNAECKKELYYKRLDEISVEFGKCDYIDIINSLMRQFNLQLPEYVPLGNIFDSIYTIEEFVERYSI